MTFINAKTVVESLGNFRKLPRKSAHSLGFTLVARTFLGHNLGTGLGRSLVLTNDPTIFIYYQNGLFNSGFVSSIWANA